MNKTIPKKLSILLLNRSILWAALFLGGGAWAQLLPDHITISVPRGDDNGFVTMELDKYNVRDPNHCKFYIDPQNHTTPSDPSGANPSNFTEVTLNNANYPVRTYRGYVVEEPNSTVIAVIWPGNNTMSAFTQEGIRYLWDINDLPISLNLTTGQGSVSVSTAEAYTYSSINSKSKEWVPTFGNPPYPTPGPGSGPVTNGNSPYGWKLIPSSPGSFKKLQVAYDVEPEWFNDASRANGNDQKLFAILEAATNALDLQFARDLGMQFRLTGVVRRSDTDLHTAGSDVKATWTDNGLADNPGASNVKPNSIPVQQIVYTQIGEGNPSAFQSRKPLAGGNYTKVPVRLDENSGLQHEISHNWGGAHFVYPNDIMSGGGSWFGPTTNQRHVFNRDDATIAGNLPIATNAEYNWNVHPYSTPDLARTNIGQAVTIGVLKNDFDSNGDPVKISQFDATSANGGTVTMNNGNLIYTPPAGFRGRDEFNYTISDGSLFNTTWVQVDVNDGGLLMRYDFETGGNTLSDQAGSSFDATAENFTGSTTTGIAGNGWNFPQLPNANDDNDDTGRAFVSFGDVIDPLDGGHTVSLWFKMDSYSINDGQNCYIVSNSSTAINKLISGYNIFMEKTTKNLTFQLSEQLDFSDPGDAGTILEIIGNTIQANTWYHIVMVVDRTSNQMRAYVNGSQVGTAQSLRPNGMIKGKPNGDRYTSGALAIATYKPKKYTPFVGTMDEFRVYGRGLTNTEIQSLYNNPGALLDSGNAPSAPTGLTANAGNGTVSLDWNDNTEADFASYNVKRSTTSGSGYVQIASGLSSSAYTDNTVTNGTTYYYVVSAVNNTNDESSNSTQIQALPQASGSTLSFSPADDAYVRSSGADTNYDRAYLRLKGGADPIESYLKFNVTGTSGNFNATLRLFSKDNIDNATIHLASSNSWDETSLTWNNKPSYGGGVFTVNNITADTWHEFDVSSIITGNGTYTLVVTTTMDVTQLDFQSKEDVNIPELRIVLDTTSPVAPTGLSGAANDGSVTLDWNDNTEPDLSSYTVKRSTTSGSGYVPVATGVTSSAYTDNTVTNGTTYYYVVSAVDNAGNESTNSSQVQATPQASAGSSTFNPTDDAYVRFAGAATTYNRVYLRLRGGAEPIESFLKFPVTGITGTVTSAKLRLYAKDDIANVSAHLASSNAWDETTLTWNNKPSYGSSLSTIAVTNNTWHELDVTSAVPGNGTYTFTLTSTVDIAQLDFQSKEDVNIPELVVTTGGSGSRLGSSKSLSTVPGNSNVLTVYPNTFDKLTNVQYTIEKAGHVSLSIFNHMGQKVKTLVDSDHVPGTYTIQWVPSNDSSKTLGAGLYFVRLAQDSEDIQTVRIVSE